MNTQVMNPVTEIILAIGSSPGISYPTLMNRLSSEAIELIDCVLNDEDIELGFDFILNELVDVETTDPAGYTFFLTDLGEQAFEELVDE